MARGPRERVGLTWRQRAGSLLRATLFTLALFVGCALLLPELQRPESETLLYQATLRRMAEELADRFESIDVGARAHASSQMGNAPADHFFPPKPGIAVACFIHDATWRSSRSSADARSTPRESLPMPIGATGGTGSSDVPRPNVSLT
jgi:hypothetical protein